MAAAVRATSVRFGRHHGQHEVSAATGRKWPWAAVRRAASPGRIGAQLAEFASSLFGVIIGHDPYLAQSPEATARLEALSVRLAGFDEVLASADELSLHLPLTPGTRGIINAESLARMKPGSYLVNVSRGQLIDTPALARALDSGQIRGAGLDVLDAEPAPADHPLLAHERTIVTPHVGFLSDHTLAEYVRIQAQNVISLSETGEPETVPVVDPR